MKKISLLLFASLTLAACDTIDNNKPMVIIEVNQWGGKCLYAMQVSEEFRNDRVQFFDSCGKFKIGDTLKFKRL